MKTRTKKVMRQSTKQGDIWSNEGAPEHRYKTVRCFGCADKRYIEIDKEGRPGDVVFRMGSMNFEVNLELPERRTGEVDRRVGPMNRRLRTQPFPYRTNDRRSSIGRRRGHKRRSSS